MSQPNPNMGPQDPYTDPANPTNPANLGQFHIPDSGNYGFVVLPEPPDRDGRPVLGETYENDQRHIADIAAHAAAQNQPTPEPAQPNSARRPGQTGEVIPGTNLRMNITTAHDSGLQIRRDPDLAEQEWYTQLDPREKPDFLQAATIANSQVRYDGQNNRIALTDMLTRNRRVASESQVTGDLAIAFSTAYLDGMRKADTSTHGDQTVAGFAETQERITQSLIEARAQTRPGFESAGADASFLAIEPTKGNGGSDGVTVTLVGNAQLFMYEPAQGHIPGDYKSLRVHGDVRQATNSVFMTNRERADQIAKNPNAETPEIIFVEVPKPMRLIGANAGFDLGSVDPEEFKAAMALADPEDAIRRLEEVIVPGYNGDRAIFVVDVAPEVTPIAQPIVTPSVTAPKPQPQPQMKPISAPQPSPIPPANQPEHRILEAASDRGYNLLIDIARVRNVDMGDPDSYTDPILQHWVEVEYAAAQEEYTHQLARRHNRWASTGKAVERASERIAAAFEARNVLFALGLEDNLLSKDPHMAEADRDILIERAVMDRVSGQDGAKSMLAGISTDAYKARMTDLGWTEAADGTMVPPTEGWAKYAHMFSQQWAEWGGKFFSMGTVKRAAIMAAPAAALALAGLGGAPLGAVAGLAAASRSLRAGGAAGLNRRANILSSAEDVRDSTTSAAAVRLYTSASQTPGQYGFNAVFEAYNKAARLDAHRNGLSAIIGGLGMANGALLGYMDGGRAMSWLRDRFDSLTSHVNTSGSIAPRPTNVPSTGQQPSAASRPSGARPSTSPSTQPTTSPSTQPTGARPSTGTPTEKQPGNPRLTATQHPRGGTTQPPTGGEVSPAPANNAIELHVTNNNQTVSDVLSKAKGGNFTQNWQTALDSVKDAEAVGQMRTIHQNGIFYWQTMVNGHWTDNTTDVVKTLTKFSKNKLALAA